MVQVRGYGLQGRTLNPPGKISHRVDVANTALGRSRERGNLLKVSDLQQVERESPVFAKCVEAAFEKGTFDK